MKKCNGCTEPSVDCDYYSPICSAMDKFSRNIRSDPGVKPFRCRTSGGEKGYMCGACHRLIKARDVDGCTNYCSFCGTKFDWSDI